jgi:hypothetical protein
MFLKPVGAMVYPEKPTTSGNEIMKERENPKLRVPAEVEDRILHLRTTYHLGQLRISWYLARYHGIKVSHSGVYSVLKRNGLNRLPQNQFKRSMEPFKRSGKSKSQATQIQMDVKFLYFKDILAGREIRRFQYTATW